MTSAPRPAWRRRRRWPEARRSTCTGGGATAPEHLGDQVVLGRSTWAVAGPCQRQPLRTVGRRSRGLESADASTSRWTVSISRSLWRRARAGGSGHVSDTSLDTCPAARSGGEASPLMSGDPAGPETVQLTKRFGSFTALDALSISGRWVYGPSTQRCRQDTPSAWRSAADRRRVGPDLRNRRMGRCRWDGPAAGWWAKQGVLDCSARSTAGSIRVPGGAGRAVRVRPVEEGPRVLQGEPAEDQADRGVHGAARPAALDEPTSGLDPLMEQQFRACVEVARTSQTVFSSHILEVRRLRSGRHPPQRSPSRSHARRPAS